MSCFSVQTTKQGMPICNILVFRGNSNYGLPHLRRFLGNKKQLFKALIDTGSSLCCITSDVSKALKLRYFAKKPLITGHGEKDIYFYRVDLHLPIPNDIKANDTKKISEFISLWNIPVGEIEPNNEFDIILGMNVINTGNLTIGQGIYTFCM